MLDSKLEFQKDLTPQLTFVGACSHGRAHEIYVESIYRRKDKNAFKSTACDSYENFENGKCVSNLQMPMGEALSSDM